VKRTQYEYGPLSRLILAIPVLGWMLREVIEGDEQALAWFVASLVGALGVATLVFGLPGLVIGMLGMAVLTLGTILLVTTG